MREETAIELQATTPPGQGIRRCIMSSHMKGGWSSVAQAASFIGVAGGELTTESIVQLL